MPSDPTFTSYTRTQAQRYAQNRLSYPPKLYDTILNYHTSTGGQLNVLADIGCGPGRATRDLASSFDYAIGLDPGVEMIEAAKNLSIEEKNSGSKKASTRTGREVEFAVCGAENCAKGIKDILSATAGSTNDSEEGCVDLLTSAMAAHWFSMPAFWTEAAQVVKAQGTVALWTCSSLYCHPSTPNAAAVQKALFRLERDQLAPYELRPNRLSRDMYTNLILPWQVESTATSSDEEVLAAAFPEAEFVRHEWDRDGVLTDRNGFFLHSQDESGGETTLSDLESQLGTASMVTRWRQAHPDLAGTEKDCVKEMVTEVKMAMGVREDENPKIKVGAAAVLLLFKRK